MILGENTRQIILSSDGKHTVIATADNAVEAEAALKWAVATYDQIVARYGTKEHPVNGQQGSIQAIRPPLATNAPLCAVHGQPMARRVGPRGPFWSCSRRMHDGSFCKYKPTGTLA